MARQHDLLLMENELVFRIPADAHTYEGFQRWLESDEFPETARIDFLGGEIDVDTGWDDLCLVIPADAHTFEGDYVTVPPDEDGWRRSPCLERAFRLGRFHQPPFPWTYRLEHKSSA